MGTVGSEFAPFGGAVFEFEFFGENGRNPFRELSGRILCAENFADAA